MGHSKATTYMGEIRNSLCLPRKGAGLEKIWEALQDIHEEASLRYYGCGLVISECLENCQILDLGSGIN